jgi:hypothetical protein
MGMGWKRMVETEIGAACGTMAAVEIGVVGERNGAERAVAYWTKNGVVLVHGIDFGSVLYGILDGIGGIWVAHHISFSHRMSLFLFCE